MGRYEKLEETLILLCRDGGEPRLSSCWCCEHEYHNGNRNVIQGGEDDPHVGLNSKPCFGPKDVEVCYEECDSDGSNSYSIEGCEEPDRLDILHFVRAGDIQCVVPRVTYNLKIFTCNINDAEIPPMHPYFAPGGSFQT